MSGAFQWTYSFDQPLDDWDMSNVTNTNRMFYKAIDFNQSLDSWDMSSVDSLKLMFRSASAFDQSLATWDIGSAESMDGMFLDAGLSVENYDSTLISWAGQSVQPGVVFDGGSSQYCAAAVSRQYLIDSLGWSISDGGIKCYQPDELVMTWTTTAAGDMLDAGVVIPILSSPGTNYNVDWNNDGVDDVTGLTGPVAYEFANPGTYQIIISGSFPQFVMGFDDNSAKLTSVDQWGANQWDSLAFYGCYNLAIPATDAPDLSNTTSMNGMFAGGFGLQ